MFSTLVKQPTDPCPRIKKYLNKTLELPFVSINLTFYSNVNLIEQKIDHPCALTKELAIIKSRQCCKKHGKCFKLMLLLEFTIVFSKRPNPTFAKSHSAAVRTFEVCGTTACRTLKS